MTETKKCTKCGEVKGSGEYYKDKRGVLGIQSVCKKCKNKQSLEWARKNPSKVKIADKKYRDNNPDKIKALNKKRDPQVNRDSASRWAKANREKAKLNYMKWCESNKSALSRYSREWRLRNLEKAKAVSLNYYYSNLDKIKEYRLVNSGRIKHRKKLTTEELKDPYIKHQLKRSNLPITPETIELKRNIILIKRFKKQVHEKSISTSK